MKLSDLNTQQFLEQLASSAPVPGGGGASALVGAIGVALGNMVGSLTIGKKKYAAVQTEILELKQKSDTLQNQLFSMVAKDAAVFAPLAKAYGMPSGTEEEKKEKANVMENALRGASAVPLEIMQLCMEAFSVIKRFAKIGSISAISDAGVAAVCCRASLNGASLNIFINTKSMQNRTLADQLNQKAEAMLRDGNREADEIFSLVRKNLN